MKCKCGKEMFIMGDVDYCDMGYVDYGCECGWNCVKDNHEETEDWYYHGILVDIK